MATDWPAIHAERAALAADLDGLGPTDWQADSLCAGWSVHDVLAHVVATATMTPPKFLFRFARAGFDFGRFNAANVAREGAGGPATTLARFRAVASSTSSPPGPGESWLGEAIVHAEDIRRPLGVRHEYPPGAVATVIRFYASSNVLIGGRNRVAGLQLKATDQDFSLGQGPVVSGPALALLLATTGRKVALAELSGQGLEELRSRS